MRGLETITIGSWDNLVEASEQFDFAILVLTPDDMITKRGSVRPVARDNVLFARRSPLDFLDCPPYTMNIEI